MPHLWISFLLDSLYCLIFRWLIPRVYTVWNRTTIVCCKLLLPNIFVNVANLRTLPTFFFANISQQTVVPARCTIFYVGVFVIYYCRNALASLCLAKEVMELDVSSVWDTMLRALHVLYTYSDIVNKFHELWYYLQLGFWWVEVVLIWPKRLLKCCIVVFVVHSPLKWRRAWKGVDQL